MLKRRAKNGIERQTTSVVRGAIAVQPAKELNKRRRVRSALRTGGLAVLLLAGAWMGMGPGSDPGWGQTGGPGIPNLIVQSVQFSPSFFIEDPRQTQLVQIDAVIANDGTADITSGGFTVAMSYRRETETSFTPIPTCTGTAYAFTEESPMRVREQKVATCFLSVATFQTGRYVIRVEISPAGISQSSVEDDVKEALLLIGLAEPEFHPISLVFSPPSPVVLGTRVTVRVQIENTGRPDNPPMDVVFEYCPLPTGATFCAEEDFTSVGFAAGIKSLSSAETRPLSEGRVLEVSDVINTAVLASGRYLFRVRVEPQTGTELDETNNAILAFLRIAGEFEGPVGPNAAICQLGGDVITLGRGVGTSAEGANVAIIYVGVTDDSGRTTLHAFRKSDIDEAEPGSTCPEIQGSPLTLPDEITSFALDQRVKLLYIGLANGQLYVVNIDTPETLLARTLSISGRALTALAPRLAGSGVGQVFVGTADGNLFRAEVRKDADRTIVRTTSRLCVRGNAAVTSAMIFKGNLYFGTDDGRVYRMSERVCDESETVFFEGTGSVRALGAGVIQLTTTTTDRVLIGLDNGRFHILNLAGRDVSGSPIALGEPITALAVDRGRQTAYVGTLSGKVHTVDLNERFVRCSLEDTLQGAVQVLAVDDGGDAGELPNRGTVLIGSEDAHFYVMDWNTCALEDEPQRAQGPIRADFVLDPKIGIFGVEGVTVFFGGGSGLYRVEIP